jgi:ferredoxin-NADP reductase
VVRDLNPVWRPARVIENRYIARGSIWITVEATDDEPAEYEAGHVLGLGLQQEDGHYLRHAYTISRGEPQLRRFTHLYRVIPEGRLTPILAQLQPGDPVSFIGPYHTPIRQEIQPDAERIVLIGTGTGVGPLFGYAEKTLPEGETRPLTLYAGFHEEADFCLVDELRTLERAHPNFAWHFTVTHPSVDWGGLRGRVTESVPPLIPKGTLQKHHFHLVGNGNMVHLVRKALYRAGMPAERVSIETYFNHHLDVNEEDVELVADRFRQSNGSPDLVTSQDGRYKNP